NDTFWKRQSLKCALLSTAPSKLVEWKRQSVHTQASRFASANWVPSRFMRSKRTPDKSMLRKSACTSRSGSDAPPRRRISTNSSVHQRVSAMASLPVLLQEPASRPQCPGQHQPLNLRGSRLGSMKIRAGKVDIQQTRVAKGGLHQVRAAPACLSDMAIGKVRLAGDHTPSVGASEVTFLDQRPIQASLAQNRLGQRRVLQAGVLQVGRSQVGLIEPRFRQGAQALQLRVIELSVWCLTGLQRRTA